MFSFFRKSKRDSDSSEKKDKKNKDNKESTPTRSKEGANIVVGAQGSKDMCKNNIQATSQKFEIAPESDARPLPNYSSEFVLPKNVTNAVSQGDTLNEKIDSKLPSANPDIIATMCDDSGPPVDAIPQTIHYGNMFKKPEIVSVSERRGSSVKPCGHGTTGITPRMPIVIGGKRENTSTPPASPILETKKPFRPIRNGTEGRNEDDKDTVTASMKLHVNLPITVSEEIGLKNGVEEEDMKNLINQEAKFQSQLNDLTKQLSLRDAETNKLKFEMEELQRDVFAKSAGMDRLQSELNAANKESESIRQRIRHLENELENFRARNSQLTDEISEKSAIFNNYEKEAKAKIEELEHTVQELRNKIENLEEQLKALEEEKVKLEERHAELVAERDEEKKKVAENLEQATKQKGEIEKKWKEDFEKLRTINILKEQQLLDDFEWKLREVQQKCRKRLDDKDKDVEERLQDAYKEAERKMKIAEEMMQKIENLQVYETEVEKLRGVTTDQEKAMNELMEQQEQMKSVENDLKQETKRLRTLIDIEKENLHHIQLKHHQEMVDKERHLKQTLNQKRTEIAMYWEERLLHECGRLKSELEQIHNEEKWMAMESVRKTKDEAFQKAQSEWEQKLRDCLKEVSSLKKSLTEKDEYYRDILISQQTSTDRDIMELRRLMDKIDMSHHNKYEKLLIEHEEELDKINEENEKKLKEVEQYWQSEVSVLRDTVDSVKEQMEKESQQKIEKLIQQHRNELDAQWENLIHQKGEAIELLQDEYVRKYKTLEEQFYTQQKSHSVREVELLKTIDSLKNELESKESTIDDLQNNVDTLEGGVQVLNQEIAQHGDDLAKTMRDADQKIKGLQDMITKLQEEHEKEREAYRLKFLSSQKQSQESIDYLQKKCQCLTKLFEEVRQRYERRDSRQEDLNTISDLKQVIAEQEKDLTCINEEKRYFQMRLMTLEKHLEENASNASAEEEEFEDAHANPVKFGENSLPESPSSEYPSNGLVPNQAVFNMQNGAIFIPPTIPECDDCDE